jgi:DNA polymerase (family 10)
VEHILKIREADRQMNGRIRILTGIEVDILGGGRLDLSDEVLAQMDVVIASVHSLFQQEQQQMTDRVLRALENPFVRILGHPTGRLLLKRDAFAMDMRAVILRAAELGVALEHNAAPERLDLNETHLRLARELGAKVVVSTDAHHTSHLEKIRYGISQLRRAWFSPNDVINTRSVEDFLAQLRPRP